jgi:hypothetical protein
MVCRPEPDAQGVSGSQARDSAKSRRYILHKKSRWKYGWTRHNRTPVRLVKPNES